MAGDWMTVDHELPDKPEVLAIYEATGIEIGTIIGRLMLFWRLADRQSTDGTIAGCGIRALCMKCGGDESFWKAVESVGWLDLSSGSAAVPNFELRFGKSAKARMVEAHRKQTVRAEKRWSGQEPDKNRTETGQKPDTCPENVPPATGQKPDAAHTSVSVSESVSVSLSESKGRIESNRIDQKNLLGKLNSEFRPQTAPDRAFLTRVSLAVAGGKIPEHCAFSALEAVRVIAPTKPLAYFRSVLRDECSKAEIDLAAVLKHNHATGPPINGNGKSIASSLAETLAIKGHE